MSGMDDMVAWLTAQIDADEASDWPHRPNCQMLNSAGKGILGKSFSCNCDAAARWYREIEAKRRIMAEHLPQWRTVEWDHDQNGKGEALCCPRCQNAEHSEWNPPLGRARGLPEGFVTPYVLAPCRTLRLLTSAFADRPGYQESWRP